MHTALQQPTPGINVVNPLPEKALIVDDEHSTRAILKPLLEHCGYQVIQAVNGLQALQLFESERPDIVFMDLAMPLMNGYEAARKIRALETQPSVPIIFLTSLTDEHSLTRCMEAGGDDFLTKPFSPILLKAKLLSIQKLRSLHTELGSLYNRMKQDEAAAESVFSGAVVADNVAMDAIKSLLRPADVFSGDVLLSAYSPAGNLNLILGDFTGHGLASALGALPASEVFRAMTNKGFASHQILAGINRKLLSLMPTGMFFAVQFVSVDRSLEKITVCNCGMPDVLLLDGRDGTIKHRFRSRSLPLSISGEIDFQSNMEHFTIQRGDRILLVSDGVVEARNRDDEYFSQKHLEQTIRELGADGSVVDGISQVLSAFCGDAPQDDDISLAEIPCLPGILPQWEVFPQENQGLTSHREKAGEGSMRETSAFSLTLSGQRLRQTDPIPLVINQLLELEQLQEHQRALFTILTELYINALDHGVLQLDSDLKQSPEGFRDYFSERNRRLRRLQEGSISIWVRVHSNQQEGRVIITLEDSGDGFDPSPFERGEIPPVERFSGRGILLLNSLCASLSYHPPGNRVEAIFCWNRELQ